MKPSTLKVQIILLLLAFILPSTESRAAGNTFPASGNVGIGTLNPGNYKLRVVGDTRVDKSLFISDKMRFSIWKSPMGNRNYYLDLYNQKATYAGDETGFRICGNKNCDKGGKIFSTTSYPLVIEVLGSEKKVEVRNTLAAKELRAATVCVSGKCRQTWPSMKNFWKENGHNVYRAKGRVGLGVSTPKADLHIKGNLKNRKYATLRIENSKGKGKGAQLELINGDSTQIQFNLGVGGKKNGKTVEDKFFIWKQRANGSAGDLLLTLDTAGTLKVRKVKVTQKEWSDYVFDKNYPLPAMEEVERFIEKEKHLPGVPSAEEVARDGIDLGQINATLLKKIEELTLYQIELHKAVKQLSGEMKKLKEENLLLKNEDTDRSKEG